MILKSVLSIDVKPAPGHPADLGRKRRTNIECIFPIKALCFTTYCRKFDSLIRLSSVLCFPELSLLRRIVWNPNGSSASASYELFFPAPFKCQRSHRPSALISLCTPSHVHNVSVFRFTRRIM